MLDWGRKMGDTSPKRWMLYRYLFGSVNERDVE